MNIFRTREALANQERIDLPGTTIEINHELRIVFYYVDNPHAEEKDFAELFAHLKARGYLLQVVQPAAAVPVPTKR